MVVAAAHNTQLSRQIGEQLLRAICLTSQIVEADELGNRTALATDSHQRFSPRSEAGDLSGLASKGSQMVVVGPGESLVAGDVAQYFPESWTVCSLPTMGYPLLLPRAGGSQLGMLQ